MAKYCPNCDYRLDGLDMPRCPECGLPFDPDNRRTFRHVPDDEDDRVLTPSAMCWMITCLLMLTIVSLLVSVLLVLQHVAS